MNIVSAQPHDHEEDRSLHWAEDLLSDSKDVVVRLMREPLLSIDELRRRIEFHRDAMTHNANLLTDVPLARAIADRLIQMIDGLDASIPPTQHRLIQVAVRYYEFEPDEDLASPFGLHDDVEVMNAVAEALQREDLILTS